MTNFIYNFWFIQFIGVVAIIFSILSWNSNVRKKILKLQSINAFLFIIHYYLLGAFAGAVMSGIILARNLVFTQKNENKWAANKIWFYIFTILSLAGVFYSWKGVITFLPALGVIIATHGLYQDSPKKIRGYILIACLLWIPYAIVVHSYSGIISNIIASFGVIVGMYRLDRKVNS